MRVMISLLAIGLAAAPSASLGGPHDAAKLARATAGRIAQPAVDCIDRRRSGDFSVAGDQLIFGARGRVLYVNRVSPGCSTGLSRQALVFRSTSSRLCAGDIAEAVDPLGGAAGGSCSLGRFVPWAR